jgi:hypothetical protein
MKLVGVAKNVLEDVLRVPPGCIVHFQLIYLGSSRGVIIYGAKNPYARQTLIGWISIFETMIAS